MNGYQVDTANLAELSRIGNSNQIIGDVEPQATITTIPLTLILTAHLCAPVTIITVTFKKRCF